MNKKTLIAIMVIIIVAIVGYMAWKKKHEHPGGAMEHPGTEEQKPAEGSQGSSLETPNQEQAAVDQKTEFTAQDIKDAMLAHIESKVQADNGVLKIYDDKASQVLQLKFVKIHDPVRKIEGKGYFACTDFEVVGEAGKLYDLDFWLSAQNGALVVTDTRIHKEPTGKIGAWEKKERYTFVNDNPVEVN